MINRNVQYCALVAFMMLHVFLIFNMPPVLTKNRNSMLLQELSQPSDFVKIDPPECLQTKGLIDGITTRICIKPASVDKMVSKYIKERGAWEPKYVNSILKMVQRFPEATFLDVGSNIGMFSLPVAAMNRSVVAVDALPVNLAYIRKSLSLGGFSQNVRFINNAVGDSYTLLYPFAPFPGNPGATFMKTSKQVKEENLGIAGPPTISVMMKDILEAIESKEIILKMDIEGYECKALQPEILLNKVGKFIPFIFIEWRHLNRNPECNEWVKNFYIGGYFPVHPETLKPIEEKDRDSFMELAWVHQSVLEHKI